MAKRWAAKRWATKRWATKRWTLGIAAALAFAGPARAVPVLDAHYLEDTTITFVHQANANTLVQTFTALSTAPLTEFDLYFRRLDFGGPASFTVSLTTTVNGGPVGGVPLASFSFTSADVTADGFKAFRPTVPVPVQAGTVYALYFTGTHEQDYANVGLAGAVNGHYDGGAAYNSRSSDGTLVGPRTFDIFFETFVDDGTTPTAVPEPGSAALLAAGLALLAARRRAARP